MSALWDVCQANGFLANKPEDEAPFAVEAVEAKALLSYSYYSPAFSLL